MVKNKTLDYVRRNAIWLVLVFPVLFVVVASANAQEFTSDEVLTPIQPEVVTPAEPAIDKVLSSNLAKNPLIQDIIATSSISGEGAVTVYYDLKNKEEIVTALYRILDKLDKIEKNTR